MGVVKKYGNRRLYDTTESAYITLDDLAERIRAGESVTVVDAKSGKDLTQQTLAHIILDSRGGSKLLPVPLLEELIRMGDASLAEFFGMYVSGALQVYQSAKRGAQMMMPYNPFAQALAATLSANPFTRMFGSWPMGGASPPPAPPAAPPREPDPPPRDDTADEVAALRRELDAIKAALAGATAKDPPDGDG